MVSSPANISRTVHKNAVLNNGQLVMLTPTRHKFLSSRPGSLDVPWWVSLFIFVILSLLILIVQQLDFQQAAAQGLIVPDVVNMAQTIQNVWLAGNSRSTDIDFIGVNILYGWTWLVHPGLCFLINMLLMLGSIFLYTRNIIFQMAAPGWSILGLVGNPYLLLAMPGPNKEIPLLFLTLSLFVLLLRRQRGWFIGSVLLCYLIFLFRDGYGAFLFGSVLLIFFLKSKDKYFALLACTACITAAIFYGQFSSFIPILKRNAEIFDAISKDGVAIGALASALGLDSNSPVGGAILYAFRLLYNLVSMALFPVLETVTGEYYWIGIGYWLFGFFILLTFPACVMILVKYKKFPRSLVLMGGLVVAAWFMVSVSLFVQPRYLMPVLPLAVGLFSLVPVKLRNQCLASSLFVTFGVMGLYSILDRKPPAADQEYFDTPPYIWVL